MNLWASKQTLISRIETIPEPIHTHLLPILEKAKRLRRGDAILTRDHRTHLNAQIDLKNETCCCPSCAFPCPFNCGSSSNTGRSSCTRVRRGREHCDDGAMGVQQAAKRRRLRRGVDWTVAECARGARRGRAAA
jgi:hypothetical protein